MIMDIVTICKKSQYYKHIVHQLKDIVTPRPQCMLIHESRLRGKYWLREKQFIFLGRYDIDIHNL